MKKILILLLHFFLVSGCIIDAKKNSQNQNLVFSEDLTFDEFKNKLEIYSKISNYPKINE